MLVDRDVQILDLAVCDQARDYDVDTLTHASK